MMQYTNKELIQIVDNKPDATELERELANRLDSEQVLLEAHQFESVNSGGPRWEKTQ